MAAPVSDWVTAIWRSGTENRLSSTIFWKDPGDVTQEDMDPFTPIHATFPGTSALSFTESWTGIQSVLVSLCVCVFVQQGPQDCFMQRAVCVQ